MDDKIPKHKLDKILREVDSLKGSEREYIKGLLDQHVTGGISRREIAKGIHRLKTDTSDHISRDEAERVKKTLLSHLED